MSQSQFNKITWLLVGLSLIFPIIVWSESLDWDILNVSAFQFFPLLGLLAWMIMHTHYITAAIRLQNNNLKKPKYYSSLTGWSVLGLILLHPGILAYKQFKLGAGLPPSSYVDYVGNTFKIAVMFGAIALIIFLSFEFFDRMKNNRIIIKYSFAISVSQALAMILIFVHALRLGSHTQSGWFLYLWIGYGIALFPCFYIINKFELNKFKKINSL